MKKTIILLAAIVTTASALLGGQPDLTKLPPASSRKGITYEKDIRPLFAASCFGCHGEKQQKGGIRLDSLQSVLQGGKEGKILTPGKSKESVLLIAVAQIDEEMAMPPKFKGGGPGRPPGGAGQPPKPLTTEEVGLVRAWIEQGAK